MFEHPLALPRSLPAFFLLHGIAAAYVVEAIFVSVVNALLRRDVENTHPALCETWSINSLNHSIHVHIIYPLHPGQSRIRRYQDSVPNLDVDKPYSMLRPQTGLHDAATNSTLGVSTIPSCPPRYYMLRRC